MSLKKILKKFIPVSAFKSDRHYEELKKENAEIKKLLKELQSDIGKKYSEEKTKTNTIKKDVATTRKMVYDSKRKVERIEALLLMGGRGVTEEKRNPQIIVSLTSYPKRINTVPLVLDRIFNQTVKPDKVVLYLSKDNFPDMEYGLPERLINMKAQGLEIRWCDGDIRSYKKFIPALHDFPDDIVITIDDDLYYELDFIEHLYISYWKHPDAVSSYRTHRIRFDDNGNIKPYKEWDMEYSEIVDTPTHILFPTNGAGSLFPPHIFDEEIFNEDNFTKICPSADDVWIKMMCVLSDVKIVLVKPFTYLYYVDGTQEESLWSRNQGENDVQIQQFLNYYNDFHKGMPSLLDRIRESYDEPI